MATFEKIIVSPTAPSTPSAIWLNPEDGKLYAPLGAKWTEVSSDADTVEAVEELPEIKGNEDKIFRKKDDNGVYVAAMTNRETITTNRLPDEQQIDKAYLYTVNDAYVFKYKGAYTLECTDGNVNGYGWHYYDDSDESDYFIITFDNAESIKTNSSYYWCETYANIDFENKIIDVGGDGVPGISVSQVEDDLSILDDGDYLIVTIPAIYNAPESAQIGNATIMHTGYMEDYTYSGTPITIESYNKENVIEGYEWRNGSNLVISTKCASDIFFENLDGFISDTKFYSISLNEVEEYFDYDSSTNTYTLDSEDYSLEDFNMGNQDVIGNLYIPQLNAPDYEQVGNAKISIVIPRVSSRSTTYTGEEVTIAYQSEEIRGYKWIDENDDSGYIVTTEKAEDIYSKADGSFYTVNNGNVSQITGLAFTVMVLTILKYQRTETTEEWEWKELAIKEEEPEVIEIHNDGDLYKLDGFTTPGIYNDIKLFVSDYINGNDEAVLFPATLTVSTDDAEYVGQLIQYTVIRPAGDSYSIYLMFRSCVEDTWQNPNHAELLYEY